MRVFGAELIAARVGALRKSTVVATALICMVRGVPGRAFLSPAPARLFRASPYVLHAQPRKKLPERSIFVVCAACKSRLFKYKKGGKGSLVKCYKERIVEDFTGGHRCECPQCGQQFARETMIHGRPALKIIGGKALQD